MSEVENAVAPGGEEDPDKQDNDDGSGDGGDDGDDGDVK